MYKGESQESAEQDSSEEDSWGQYLTVYYNHMGCLYMQCSMFLQWNDTIFCPMYIYAQAHEC